MLKFVAVLCLCCFLPVRSQAENGPNWLRVQTEHFTVYTDGSDRQARHTAGQLERMHAIFAKLLPGAADDPGASIVVLALRDRKGFQTVEPASYLAKNALDLAGLFLRGDDRSYILLRLDTAGDNPYETVYHEYTHYALRHAKYLPLWLNEGFAQFYQNTDIFDSEAKLGQPNGNELQFLRTQRPIPLETLFRVDHDSPYYHESDKGNIFYGESWALTHFLFMADFNKDNVRLTSYARDLVRGEDSLTAARHAFGDLNVLQSELNNYIERGQYLALRMPFKSVVDEKSMDVRPVPTFQADAVRADVLARDGRTKEAELLAKHVIDEAPESPEAHESMGWIKLREGDTEGARQFYTQAVSLHSTNFLAFYYAGALGQRDGKATPQQIWDDLHKAIELSPGFAPALISLAQFDGTQHDHLDEALQLCLRAVQIDPGNIEYRMAAADIRVRRNEVPAALAVLKTTLKFAQTPEEHSRVANRLNQLQSYADKVSQQDALLAEGAAETATGNAGPRTADTHTVTDAKGKVLHPIALREPDHKLPEGPPSGPTLTVAGTIHNVGCFYPKGMTLRLDGAAAPVNLYSNDMYAIAYSSGNFTPEKDLDPCRDFDGLKARVTYAKVDDPSVAGQIVSMELSR